MTIDQIRAAIDDRLRLRWAKRLTDEGASPVCVIGITQLCGSGHRPVICCTEDTPDELLIDLLTGVANMLRAKLTEAR